MKEPRDQHYTSSQTLERLLNEALEFLGLQIETSSNAKPSLDADVATADSRVRILVIRAQEDWAIARECWKLI